jgi:hypothetical protein
MPLDIFQHDQAETLDHATRNSGADLPATFGETFETAFLHAALFGHSTAALTARTAAAANYADELETRTGDRSLKAALASGGIERLNKRIAQIAADRPDLSILPLDEVTLTERQAEQSRQAVSDFRAMQQREKTLGGQIGFIGGEAAGGITDPINLVTFPLAAPVGLGILGTAAAWAGIGATTQSAIELAGASYRDRVEPGYLASGQPLENVVGAAAFAGGLGGAFKSAAELWSAIKARGWPQSIRDAGNAVEGEANVLGTNRYPGAEGETLHRAALGKSIDDIAAGRPVDVDSIIPDELQTLYRARFSSIDEARARAALTGTPEDLGDVAFELQNLARQAGHSLPRQDADQIATQLIALPDDEARSVLDELLLRPRTLADTLPLAQETAVTKPALATGAYRDALSAELNNERAAIIPAEPATDETMLRNLDRLRLQREDLEIPVGATLDMDGRLGPVMRRVDDLLAEADARQLAAREIMSCVGPQVQEGT